MKHTAQQVSILPALGQHHQYTCATTISNHVYLRARARDGAPIYVDQKYLPTYYTPVPEAQATHRGYEGMPLCAKTYPTLYDGREAIEKSRVPVYGNIQPEYMVLHDALGTKDVEWEFERLYIQFIDIEVDSEHGFAKPEDPFAEVTSITVTWFHMGKTGTVVYGRKDYEVKGDELYIKCDTENELLLRYLDDLRSAGDYPDVITGWNVQFYDMPYLVARMTKLFTEDTWEKLSPFNRIATRNVIILGRTQVVVDIKGIAILDYLELYRKFTYSQQESYRLDHIATVELKEKKMSFKEYKTLRRLYKENHQLFIEYNIQDVRLVVRLDDKLKLLELVFALAYGAKANFADCFKQVRLWDIMIYHKLRGEGKQIPPRKDNEKGEQYEGAFVKDTKPGLYKWVCSFDVASMYPHIIREWNLSPETKIRDRVTGLTVDRLLSKEIDTTPIKTKDVCVAANGVLTDRHKEGFLPNMLKSLYDERNRFKGLQKQAKKELEKETDPVKRNELEKKVSAYGNQQLVRKVNLNSAYGAMGSAYFRFYDVALAEAVTVTGQMIIRWVAQDINTYLNSLFGTNDDYIIASDTDSVYINMEKVVALIGTDDKIKIVNALDTFCAKKIQPLIDKAFVDIAEYMNVATPCLNMIRDVIADNCVWTAKKHYIMNVFDSEGTRYKEPKLKIMGMEMIKSSTPAVVRDMMKKTLQLMVSGATQDDVWAFMKKCEKDFCSAPFEDIAKPTSVNGLKKYAGQTKGVPIHVAGSLAFNNMLESTSLGQDYEPIRDGEKVKVAYLKKPNPFHVHAMAASFGCPPEWNIEKWIDYDTQYNKVFLDPISAILKVAGWSAVKEPSLFD